MTERDLTPELIDEMLERFNGGLIKIDAPECRRGWRWAYMPRTAMRQALEAVFERDQESPELAGDWRPHGR